MYLFFSGTVAFFIGVPYLFLDAGYNTNSAGAVIVAVLTFSHRHSAVRGHRAGLQ